MNDVSAKSFLHDYLGCHIKGYSQSGWPIFPLGHYIPAERANPRLLLRGAEPFECSLCGRWFVELPLGSYWEWWLYGGW